MTTLAIRKKVIQYVEEADPSILEVVYKLLEVYRKSNSSSLTKEQQQIVMETSALYKAGKMKTYSVAEARKRIKKSISK